ncbi:MAG: biotin/lipoyl-binding protein [Deltaproteobacteria bacterium]|nr:biotin/lipoyl-binding protein [Deltaproteobacteria bacterium]
MSRTQPSSGKMTVFRSDRHEDLAAMVFVACLVCVVLGYMAYVVPSIELKAPSDGKLLSVAVQQDGQVKKGDVLYSLEVADKKYVQGQLQTQTVKKEVKANTNGKVLAVKVKPGDAVKKDKSVILVLDHEKGTLP